MNQLPLLVGAVPTFPTTTPAAAFAYATDSRIFLPLAIDEASTK